MGGSTMTFYSRQGRATAYYDSSKGIIYLFDGTPVAYFDGDRIYHLRGNFLGWYMDGWVYDRDGYCVFFTENASGGPVKPVKGIAPVRGIQKVAPVKGVKQIAPVRPIKHLSWSRYSDESFF